ncbi:glycosyltransferase family 2 protein [Geobacillus zalihae]|uniref:glycosyltransferase family 2 protein n=1 Tax=Geobacillus zalihae TaxID=213419 RepID=UPI001CC21883|nr:hypothetical protein [Geobacillus zalihae]
MTKQSTAILLFVYNRPDHTLKVLEGLKKNNVKRLYVFCDGPKTQEDLGKVERTRELIRNIDWCEVEAVFRDRNIGLASSIINGVTDIFQKGYDSVIVLEDDCVPKENFIKFMIDSLEYYRSFKEVMHISGFGLPIKKYTDADVYFTPYPCSWGWGTWADVWKGCDFSQTEGYLSLLKNNEIKKRFNYAGEAFPIF